jgi:hypothetical protein
MMKNLSVMQKGMVAAVFLTILTVAEYFFAVEIGDDLVRFIGLAVAAVLKAALIMEYFMHFTNIFHPSSEAH